MPNHDNERFEAYLKRFRPVPASPLRFDRTRGLRRRLLVAFAAVLAVFTVAGVLILQNQRRRVIVPFNVVTSKEVEHVGAGRPLTIWSANELLAHASSYSEALDGLASGPRSIQLPGNTESALRVLGKEDFKP